VIQERYLKFESVRNSGTLHAVLMGHDPTQKPKPGPLGTDPRLEITTRPTYDKTLSWPLGPYWPDYYIQPLAQIVEGYEAETRSRSAMVIGESSFLGVLLLISSVMLYRLIWTERRSAREVREFWSRATHEIKTPITGLKAFLQTLRSQDLDREQLVVTVDMALRQVGRQQQLAENILMGQRLDRGGFRLNMTRLDLPDFLSRFMEDQAFLTTGAEVVLSRNGGNGDLEKNLCVEADPDALRAILSNVTDNAMKYGGDGVRLDVSVDTARRVARVIFSDNGPGFDPRQAKRLFDAYKRLTRELPSTSRGTGMGLYISRRLARRMGGDLTAASPGPGKGARFELTLKRWQE
jgi:signal transduction histidine kinase